jgi:hypothetical protein
VAARGARAAAGADAADRLPEKRPVIDFAAVLSFLVLSVGFVAAVFLVLHGAAASTHYIRERGVPPETNRPPSH